MIFLPRLVFGLLLVVLATTTVPTAVAQEEEIGDDDDEQPPAPKILTREELSNLLTTFRTGDDRIMRWSVKNPTLLAMEQGACESLPKALDIILSTEPNDKDDDGAIHLAGMACEYATFCITDHPVNRALMSNHDDLRLHKKIVELIDNVADNYTSAMASHLVYISVFDNARNHKLFYMAGAVAALTRVILADAADIDSNAPSTTAASSSPRRRHGRNPHAIMWAAAALQNMAASYCSGRCPWEWIAHAEHIVVDADHLPVTSPGDSVRLAAWLQSPQGPALMEKLKELMCQGPVYGANVGAGTGIIERDENSRSILPWAATGALKNLVLEPVMKQLVDNPDTMACICRLLRSSDWLESNKAQGLVHHLRSQSSPCHYVDKEYHLGLYCVDRHYADADGYSCDWFDSESEDDECAATDFFNKSLSAKEACCDCGGGYRRSYRSGNSPAVKEEKAMSE